MFVQVHITKLQNETDGNTKVVVFVNDITQLKQLQMMSYKVRSMFFASVAHEFRTPLNSIIPIARLLQSAIVKDQLYTNLLTTQN
jgi:signal transduction histidine kinase